MCHILFISSKSVDLTFPSPDSNPRGLSDPIRFQSLPCGHTHRHPKPESASATRSLQPGPPAKLHIACPAQVDAFSSPMPSSDLRIPCENNNPNVDGPPSSRSHSTRPNERSATKLDIHLDGLATPQNSKDLTHGMSQKQYNLLSVTQAPTGYHPLSRGQRDLESAYQRSGPGGPGRTK